MEQYGQLTNEEIVAMGKAEILGLERQHLQRSQDVSKYSDLVAAFDAGDFKDYDSRLMAARREEFRAQLQAAEVDVKILELSLENARNRLCKDGVCICQNTTGDE